MSEVARPVVEAAVAPNTPQSEDTKSGKLSYSAASLPQPISNPDFYLHAQLVEARALRGVMERLVDAIERLADAQKPASGAAQTPLGASKPDDKPASTSKPNDK